MGMACGVTSDCEKGVQMQPNEDTRDKRKMRSGDLQPSLRRGRKTPDTHQAALAPKNRRGNVVEHRPEYNGRDQHRAKDIAHEKNRISKVVVPRRKKVVRRKSFEYGFMPGEGPRLLLCCEGPFGEPCREELAPGRWICDRHSLVCRPLPKCICGKAVDGQRSFLMCSTHIKFNVERARELGPLRRPRPIADLRAFETVMRVQGVMSPTKKSKPEDSPMPQCVEEEVVGPVSSDLCEQKERPKSTPSWCGKCGEDPCLWYKLLHNPELYIDRYQQAAMCASVQDLRDLLIIIQTIKSFQLAKTSSMEFGFKPGQGPVAPVRMYECEEKKVCPDHWHRFTNPAARRRAMKAKEEGKEVPKSKKPREYRHCELGRVCKSDTHFHIAGRVIAEDGDVRNVPVPDLGTLEVGIPAGSCRGPFVEVSTRVSNDVSVQKPITAKCEIIDDIDVDALIKEQERENKSELDTKHSDDSEVDTLFTSDPESELESVHGQVRAVVDDGLFQNFHAEDDEPDHPWICDPHLLKDVLGDPWERIIDVVVGYVVEPFPAPAPPPVPRGFLPVAQPAVVLPGPAPIVPGVVFGWVPPMPPPPPPPPIAPNVGVPPAPGNAPGILPGMQAFLPVMQGGGVAPLPPNPPRPRLRTEQVLLYSSTNLGQGITSFTNQLKSIALRFVPFFKRVQSVESNVDINSPTLECRQLRENFTLAFGWGLTQRRVRDIKLVLRNDDQEATIMAHMYPSNYVAPIYPALLEYLEGIKSEVTDRRMVAIDPQTGKLRILRAFIDAAHSRAQRSVECRAFFDDSLEISVNTIIRFTQRSLCAEIKMIDSLPVDSAAQKPPFSQRARHQMQLVTGALTATVQ